MAELPVVDMEVLAKQFDHASWKGFNQSESEFEKGYKHAMSVAARVVRESAPASPAALRDEAGLNWTKEEPKINGVYWWRADKSDDDPDIHRVVDGVFFEVGEQFSRVVEGFGGEWLGPISPAAASKETCPRCNGNGFESDSVTPCEFCGGDGWVFERDVKAYDEGHASGHREATDFCLRLNIPAATTPPSNAAAKIADQLIPHLDHAFLLTKGWRDQIASIIERSLSSGS